MAVPTDENVLHTLAYVLRPAGRLSDLTAAYERAAAKDPGSEELLTGLFASYVREFAFVKQQQAALKLQKAFPLERHQWWVVDSIVLQAHAGADAAQIAAAAATDTRPGGGGAAVAVAAPAGALGADRLLQLAESMSARLVAQRGGGIQGSEALDLYLGILTAQSKAAAALELIDGPPGAAMRIASERRQARAALLRAQGRAGEAAALYREAVLEQPDDWSGVMLYFDALLPAAAASGQAPPSSFWAVAKALTGGKLPPAGGGSSGDRDAADGKVDGEAAAAAVAEAAAFLEMLPSEATSSGGDEAAGAGSSSSSSSSGGGSSGGAKPKQSKRPAVLRGPALARVELAARRVKLGLAPGRAVAEAVLACYDK